MNTVSTESRIPRRYERVKARDIKPGDRVARARTHPFAEVRTVRHVGRSAMIEFTAGGRVKPRLDADWWRRG